jgi:hypothetical protein
VLCPCHRIVLITLFAALLEELVRLNDLGVVVFLFRGEELFFLFKYKVDF